MPVESATVINIVCDNPDCPGNDLDPHDRMGWHFVNYEVYGDTPTQHVFCSLDCAKAVPTVVQAAIDAAPPVRVLEHPAAASRNTHS